MVLFGIASVAIAAIDLANGSIVDNRHLDYALTALGAMALWGAVKLRRSERMVRAAGRPQRPKAAIVAGLIGSMTVTLAFVVGIGYLIGGWVGAALLALAFGVLTTASIARARHRRQRNAPIS